MKTALTAAQQESVHRAAGAKNGNPDLPRLTSAGSSSAAAIARLRSRSTRRWARVMRILRIFRDVGEYGMTIDAACFLVHADPTRNTSGGFAGITTGRMRSAPTRADRSHRSKPVAALPTTPTGSGNEGS
jgi:hypothetical protein